MIPVVVAFENVPDRNADPDWTLIALDVASEIFDALGLTLVDVEYCVQPV